MIHVFTSVQAETRRQLAAGLREVAAEIERGTSNSIGPLTDDADGEFEVCYGPTDPHVRLVPRTGPDRIDDIEVEPTEDGA